MSALNVVLQRSVALVFVDAAACRPNGTAIVRFAPKLALLPSCQTVVGIRGPTEILTALAKRIHAAGLATYDDVIAEIAALLLPAFKEGFRHDVREAGWIIRLLYCLPWSVLRGIPAAQFEIFVIGWSNAKWPGGALDSQPKPVGG